MFLSIEKSCENECDIYDTVHVWFKKAGFLLKYLAWLVMNAKLL